MPMLTRHDIAAMLQVSADTLRKTVFTQPSFPQPARRISDKNCLWDAAEVDLWLESMRGEEPLPQVDGQRLAQCDAISADIREHMGHRIKGAQRRCKDAGMAFNITFLDALNMYLDQGGKCAVSGIPFRMEQMGRAKMRPFAASLDRINNERGYVPGNVRLVCQCINMLMNEWGDTVYQQVAEHVRANAHQT
jgi:predicted DNA-binding transcriptional regulator AlpA